MKANILVIDDEESIRYTFASFLTLAGHTVCTAASCREAREKIDREEVDMVFSDLILPDGTGLELLRQIKAKSPDTPVIMMTAYPSLETEQETRRLGAVDFIPKPLFQHDVMQAVSRAMQHLPARSSRK